MLWVSLVCAVSRASINKQGKKEGGEKCHLNVCKQKVNGVASQTRAAKSHLARNKYV